MEVMEARIAQAKAKRTLAFFRGGACSDSEEAAMSGVFFCSSAIFFFVLLEIKLLYVLYVLHLIGPS